MTRTVRFPSPIRGASDKIIRLANEFIDSNINSGPETKQRRREQLTIFFRYFKGDIIDMDAAQYNAFIGWMRNEKKYRYETIHGIKIASIGFLRFLHRKGIRPEVEFKLQKVPRDQSRATAFSFAEYIRILDVACEARAEFNYWPSACIVGWNTGLRISDVTYLKWSDVDWDANLIRVATMKRANIKQVLEIPMEPELREHLRFLLETNYNPNSEYVLHEMVWEEEHKRCKLTDGFRVICDKAGLPNHSFKSFRHAFVTRMLNAEVDAKVIGAITGQEVATVYKYVRHVSMDAKINAMRRARERVMEITLPS